MKKIIDKLGKKKFYGILAGIVAVAIVSTTFVVLNSKEELHLKKDVTIIELGSDISLKANDYLDTNDKEVLSKTKVTTNAKKQDGLFPVGKYKVELTYEKENLEATVEVKDTKAPEFKEFKDKVEVDRDFTGDLATNFKAEDLSDVKVTIDSKDVDFAKAGTYKAKAIATDKYKNKATKDFEVVVGEKSKAEKEAEEKAKAEADAKAQEEQNQSNTNANTGNAGSTSNTGSGSSSSNTGSTGSTGNGGNTQQPNEPIVCLLNCENVGLREFNTEEEATNWAWSIWNDYDASIAFAQSHGYSNVTNWYNSGIQYGYKSTGQVTSTKHVIVWSFI